MKKIKLICVLLAMLFVLVALCACGENKSAIQQAFENTSSITSVVYTKELKDGNKLVYQQTKTYANGKVNVVTKELPSDPFATELVTTTSSESFNGYPSFDLFNESNYKQDSKQLTDTELKFKLSDSGISAFLGINKSAINGDVNVVAKQSNGIADSVVITYITSNNNSATITLKYNH